jgi:hypothetical protein
MEQAFVSRVFTTGEIEIGCLFFKPVPEAGDFRCDYRIEYPDDVESSYAIGVDEVQALILAMQKAHVDLLVSDYFQNDALNWIGMRDLGLPLPPSVTVDDFRDLSSEGS